MMATLTVEQLLQSIWAALRRIEDNMALPPAPLELPSVPAIHVEAPDLTDIVTAVTSLNGTGPTAEDIAEAIRNVLLPSITPPPDITTELTEAMKEVAWRLKGVGAQAYGGGAVSFAPGVAAQFAEAINNTTTTSEARLDYDTREDEQPVYVGRAAQGSTTAQDWTIEKVTYDEDDRPTRKQVLTGAWDDRATLDW
jgi:hypothetical protein